MATPIQDRLSTWSVPSPAQPAAPEPERARHDGHPFTSLQFAPRAATESTADGRVAEIGTFELKLERKTVLYAEDQTDCAFLFRRAYERTGFGDEVHVVPDGEQAIAYLSGKPPYADRSRYPLPDLVVLDLQMPRVSGLEVLRWMKHTPRIARIPVHVISLVLRRSDELTAKKLGASGCFVKPCSLAALAELIVQLRAQKRP